jgi:hypothetical protein
MHENEKNTDSMLVMRWERKEVATIVFKFSPFFFFFVVLWFELRAYTLNHSTGPFL